MLFRSTDNASFTLVGDTLKTSAGFDFEFRNSYSIRVRSTDSAGGTFDKVFVISVTDLNEQPTDLTLSATSVNENRSKETTVGTLNAVDPDVGDTFTYALVAGEGDTDNANFLISNNALQTNAILDFENQRSHSIRIRATDHAGATRDKIGRAHV